MKIAARVVLILLFISCSPRGFLSKKGSPDKIEFEKTGCLGNCQAFKISIDRAGHAAYEGLINTKLKGVYSRTLSEEENKSLWTLISTSQNELKQEEYDYGAEDTQQRFLRYCFGKKMREIRFGHNVPDILKKIDTEIEKIVDSQYWVKSPK